LQAAALDPLARRRTDAADDGDAVQVLAFDCLHVGHQVVERIRRHRERQRIAGVTGFGDAGDGDEGRVRPAFEEGLETILAV